MPCPGAPSRRGTRDAALGCGGGEGPVGLGVPKQVDHGARRERIVLAALEILATEGPSALTMRSLAHALGGSTALVTHYFPTRQSVVEELVEFLLRTWKQQVTELREGAGGVLEPRAFLTWLLPLSERARLAERARLSFHASVGEDREVARRLLRTIDRWMRAELSKALEPHVADGDERGRLVDLLRATVAGLVLARVEHPQKWPPGRLVGVIDDLLGRLGLQ
jgi:AcrR family transcriptional regulator